MQLSKNFTSEEFECKCGCGLDLTSDQLVEELQEARDALGGVTINSGTRCKAHNTKEGGSPNSQHLLGTAADIVVKGKTPKQVYDYLVKKYPNSHGIGLYPTFVHFDIRLKKARW